MGLMVMLTRRLIGGLIGSAGEGSAALGCVDLGRKGLSKCGEK
jgi:hypothetical protein